MLRRMQLGSPKLTPRKLNGFRLRSMTQLPVVRYDFRSQRTEGTRQLWANIEGARQLWAENEGAGRFQAGMKGTQRFQSELDAVG